MSEVATKKPEQEIVEKKRKAWGDMGVAVYESEMHLQVMAQALIQKIKLPANMNEIPEAEKILKDIKAGQREIESGRKAITSKFDDVTARLMQSEKSLNDPITALGNAIIAVKKEYERMEATRVQKGEEIRRIKEMITNFLSKTDFDFKSKIADIINRAYEHALGQGNIQPKDLSTYLLKVANKLGVVDFQVDHPTWDLKLVDLNEFQLILDETFHLNPHAYATIFRTELEKKFSDYEVAFHNKQEALALARKQEEENLKALQAEKQSKEIAAQLQSASQPVTSIAPEGVKVLKKAYVLEMPENCESALAVMAAFSGNLKLCLPKLKVTKWFSFTPAQAAVALAKVKCDDNNFQPAGILFKEVDKL